MQQRQRNGKTVRIQNLKKLKLLQDDKWSLKIFHPDGTDGLYLKIGNVRNSKKNRQPLVTCGFFVHWGIHIKILEFNMQICYDLFLFQCIPLL